jgi:hypothetical protein
MSAISDNLRWYEEKHLPQRLAELAEELLPSDRDTIDPLYSERLAQIVCERTGLPPSEFKQLDTKGKVVWLDKAISKPAAGTFETDNDLPLTPSQLADRLGIPKDDAKKREALRVRLVAWRKTTDSGWTEDDNSTGRQVKYRYRLGSVWDKIKDMKP